MAYNQDSIDYPTDDNPQRKKTTTPSPTAAPSGWNGPPPNPGDPYFAQYQKDHPDYMAGTSPTNPQIDYTSAPITSNINWGAGPWDPGRLQSYAQSRGVTLPDKSVSDWMDYWNSWGKTDPNYFFARLQEDPAFGGSAAKATTPATNPASLAGLGNFVPEPFTMPTTATQGAATAGAPNGQDAGALFQYLMSRAKQPLTVDRNDPIIRAQSDAFRAQQVRSGRDFLRQQAERNGPYGGANARTDARLVAQNVGSSVSTHEAELMGSRLEAMRSEIQQALVLAGNQLTTQQQLQLQEQLSQINAALQVWSTRNNLLASDSQFSRQLGQNAYQFDVNDEFRRSPLAAGGA